MKRSDVLKKMGLSFLSLVCLFAVIEVALQIRSKGEVLPKSISIHDHYYRDQEGCWRIVPNSRGWHNSFDGGAAIMVSINASGMRGPDLREDGSVRVAFVGDSITFNGGVVWSNSFEARVEQMHNRSLSPGIRDWQCLNFGISDTGSEDYYKKIRGHVLPLCVDYVVVGLYLNDSRPPQGFLGESSRSHFGQWLRRSGLRRLQTVRLLQEQLGALRVRLNPDIQRRFEWTDSYNNKKYMADAGQWETMVRAAKYDWGVAWDPASWVVIENDLNRIVELCRTNKIGVAVVCFPVSPQVELHGKYSDVGYPQERAKQLAEKLGIPFLDLLPFFYGHNAKDMFADNCHLTSAGNKVVADALLPWLKDSMGKMAR